MRFRREEFEREREIEEITMKRVRYWVVEDIANRKIRQILMGKWGKMEWKHLHRRGTHHFGEEEFEKRRKWTMKRI